MEDANPPKPVEFTALTQEDWDDICEWANESPIYRIGNAHWAGAACNRDKKMNPFVWTRQLPEVGGKMKKVVWSFGAYHARHYPDTEVAKEWVEWAAQFGWMDYCAE